MKTIGLPISHKENEFRRAVVPEHIKMINNPQYLYIEQGYGKIINIASMGAYLGLNRVVPYCGSKGAVMQMTKGFAVEWAKYNIQVNAIAPGYFKTELTSVLHNDEEREQAVLNRNPMKRWGNVEELTGAAIFLATDASSFVTGISIPVDGGMLAMGV